jgi:hypothetical protein
MDERKGRPNGALSCAPRLWGPTLAQRVIPAAWASRAPPVRDLFGALAQSLAVLGCAIRVLKKTNYLGTWLVTTEIVILMTLNSENSEVNRPRARGRLGDV